MLRWDELADLQPELATAGKRLLYHPDHGEVGLLATLDRLGAPRLAPVCPIFASRGIYLLIGAGTPKRQDIDRNPRYALHAQIGASDEEFQIRGHASAVEEPAQIRAVLNAITFSSYDPEDPLYELRISQALWVTWQDGAAAKHSWRVS